MASDPSDIIIVGGGPAGASVATFLAQRDRKVTLIEAKAKPSGAVCSGWLNAKALPFLDEMKFAVAGLKKDACSDVIFRSGDFKKTATPAIDGTVGYLVNRSSFDGALLDCARSAGVTVLLGHPVTNIKLDEVITRVTLGEEAVYESKLAVLALGRGTDLPERVGLTSDRSHRPIWSACVAAPPVKKVAAGKGAITLVLGLDTKGSFGMCCTTRYDVSASLHWIGEKEEARGAFVQLCQRAAEHGVIDVDLAKAAAGAAIVPSPAGAALDIESHVGKHTLVIGDAGGFVAAASNEGIYPALWSAKIAADVLDEALTASAAGGSSQDVLMTFDSRWRLPMADYLRSPHTDIQFLLPLIFSNQPMADRMAAAFFSGENI
jgi:flavin-dependent dehydrogenase